MITTQNRIQNYQFVSIAATSAQDRYYFPDLPNLRNVITHRIVSYHVGHFTNDINNQPMVTQAVFNSSFLTINSNGTEVIQKLDLACFNTVVTKNAYANQNGVFELQPMMIDFSKSYVTIGQGTILVPTFPYVYAFGIYYSK
jgi:hypothetical protein